MQLSSSLSAEGCPQAGHKLYPIDLQLPRSEVACIRSKPSHNHVIRPFFRLTLADLRSLFVKISALVDIVFRALLISDSVPQISSFRGSMSNFEFILRPTVKHDASDLQVITEKFWTKRHYKVSQIESNSKISQKFNAMIRKLMILYLISIKCIQHSLSSAKFCVCSAVRVSL